MKRCAAAAVMLGLLSCSHAPITGRKQLLLLSPSEEKQLGEQAFQQIISTEKVDTDPAVNGLVTRVGERIATATGKTDYQWQFKVIEKNQANAFCLPGGKVVVFTGILPLTRDEAGLATVLGHEIAHAVARHGGERVSEDLLVNVGLTAVQLGMGNHDPQTIRTVTGLLGAGVAVGVELPFSRAQESEADHLGLIYMAKAGYDPRAALSFWERMEQTQKGSAPPELLSDHPADAKRIQQIKEWMPEALKDYRPR